MSRLPSITPKKLVKALKYLGFQKDHTTGSHFIFYNHKTKRRAVVPLHKKDFPQGTMMSILKGAGVSRKELEDLL